MTAASANATSGTRDCPGDMYQYAYGACVENFVARSMWVVKGMETFEKNLQAEAFDPLIVLLAGGWNGNALTSVEMIPVLSPPCHVQDLPTANDGSTLVLTAQNLLLNCGGFNTPQSCLSLDVSVGGVWSHHSDLTNGRYVAVGVSLPSGTYLFGGAISPTTTDFLPASSST